MEILYPAKLAVKSTYFKQNALSKYNQPYWYTKMYIIFIYLTQNYWSQQLLRQKLTIETANVNIFCLVEKE